MLKFKSFIILTTLICTVNLQCGKRSAAEVEDQYFVKFQMEDGSFNTVHGEIDTQLFIRNNPTAVVVDASKGYVPVYGRYI